MLLILPPPCYSHLVSLTLSPSQLFSNSLCSPFSFPHSPQFFFRTADVTGNCILPKDVEMVVPGDNASIEVELINEVAMAEGLRFAIREGGKTVGAGVVSKVIE